MNNLKVKILFLGSRKLAEDILQYVIERRDLCEVKGVVLPSFEGWWEDNLNELVVENNIPVYCQIEDTIDIEYDLIISVNYWKIVPQNFLDKVNGMAVNIHHSYRLKFKGRFSTSWAIMHARKDNCWEHGTTIHYMDKSIDDGKIIATDKVLITEFDTAESLFEKVEELAKSLFRNSFNLILLGTTDFIEPSETTYYYDRYSKDKFVLPNPVCHLDLFDFVRAWTFSGRPSPTFELENGKSLVIKIKN